MLDKIKELNPYNVSKHCATLEEYKKLNVIDIPCSTLGKHKKQFLDKLNKKTKDVNKTIDEYLKSNRCIHLEINNDIMNKKITLILLIILSTNIYAQDCLYSLDYIDEINMRFNDFKQKHSNQIINFKKEEKQEKK